MQPMSVISYNIFFFTGLYVYVFCIGIEMIRPMYLCCATVIPYTYKLLADYTFLYMCEYNVCVCVCASYKVNEFIRDLNFDIYSINGKQTLKQQKRQQWRDTKALSIAVKETTCNGSAMVGFLKYKKGRKISCFRSGHLNFSVDALYFTTKQA